jgi:hypothetical protein
MSEKPFALGCVLRLRFVLSFVMVVSCNSRCNLLATPAEYLPRDRQCAVTLAV